ncbi:MAG: arylamine N-acetyltransferase [Acetobacteraceae bacterium]|nr:arylamine N-acetyltransferase [Acetobacteraceae bacterium]
MAALSPTCRAPARRGPALPSAPTVLGHHLHVRPPARSATRRGPRTGQPVHRHHPAPSFRRSLVVERTTTAGHHALSDRRLTVRASGEQVERRARLDADGIERILAEILGLPVGSAWRPVIEKAAQGAA